MAAPYQHRQFSLKATLGMITIAAIFFAVSKLAFFQTLLPGLAVLALFAPTASWLLASIMRTSHPAVPKLVYTITALYTVMMLTSLSVYGIGIWFVAVPFLLFLWLPQVMFVAFFEWCEYEERATRHQQETETLS